ncbi:MAG: hypothetical protein GX442_04595 [Candidatus Riflebacteria bacterium]|nr:hypothetical protein [Candidatus Riflebacteria bacterium]
MTPPSPELSPAAPPAAAPSELAAAPGSLPTGDPVPATDSPEGDDGGPSQPSPGRPPSGEVARGPAHGAVSSPRAWSLGLIQAVLFFGAFAIVAYQIGTPSLFETSEGRFASVARTMVESGDWLVPRFNGLVHLSKPPVAYWASAFGQSLLGVNEWGARALLPLAAACTVWGCFRIGLLFMPLRTALIGTFVLMTTLFFNAQYRGLTADPFLAMFETWMVWALLAFVLQPTSRRGLLFYAMAAGAMLTKGPPGLLPLLGLVPGLGLRHGWDRLKRLAAMPRGWALFVVLGLGWYLLMAVRFPGALSYFLFDETLARVASESHQRGGPWYYFFGILLGGTFPWTLFFCGGFLACLGRARNARDPMGLPLMLWLAVPFVVFSLSQSKLPAYALPLLIPASLMAGRYLAPMLHLNEDEPLAFKLESSLTLFFLGVFAVAVLYCAWSGVVPDPRFSKVALFLAFYLIFLTGFGYLFLSWEMAKGIILVLGLTVPGSLMFLMPGLRGDEEVAPGRFLPGYKALLEEVQHLPSQARILCIEDMLQAIPFYTGRTIPTWNVTRETRFDPGLAPLFDLHGDEALRENASGGAWLLVRGKDLAKVEPVVGRHLERLVACGPWGLYRTGAPLATIRPLGSETPDLGLVPGPDGSPAHPGAPSLPAGLDHPPLIETVDHPPAPVSGTSSEPLPVAATAVGPAAASPPRLSTPSPATAPSGVAPAAPAPSAAPPAAAPLLASATPAARPASQSPGIVAGNASSQPVVPSPGVNPPKPAVKPAGTASATPVAKTPASPPTKSAAIPGAASPASAAKPVGTPSPGAAARPAGTASPGAAPRPAETASASAAPKPAGTASPAARPAGPASPSAAARPAETVSATLAAKPAGPTPPKPAAKPPATTPGKPSPQTAPKPTPKPTAKPTAKPTPTPTAKPTPRPAPGPAAVSPRPPVPPTASATR